MVYSEKPTYYLLNETLVDDSTNRKYHEVLHENTVNVGGRRLTTLTFKQVLQSVGVRNWNGRIYSANIIMKAIEDNPLIQHDLKMNTWAGEWGHPIIEKGMNELARQMTIFPPNTCWTVANPHMEGNLLMGECTTLSGGYGDILRDRVLTGSPAMASSRSIGGIDSKGNVLPGLTMVCYDAVYRPSHREAYMVPGSEKHNIFPIATGQTNSMTESAVRIGVQDPSFRNFLLSESASRTQIGMLCDTFKLDYDSMVITENAVKISHIGTDSIDTVVIPLNRLVNAEYYNLFRK